MDYLGRIKHLQEEFEAPLKAPDQGPQDEHFAQDGAKMAHRGLRWRWHGC